MKIVDLKGLCNEPDGTVFAIIKENHQAEDTLPLQIKFDSLKYQDGSMHFNGLCSLNPLPDVEGNMENGEEYVSRMFYYDGADYELRDDGHDKFIVYNIKEVKMMIEALDDAIKEYNNFDIDKVYQIKRRI